MKYTLAVCLWLATICLQVQARGPLRMMFPTEHPSMVKNGIDPGEPLYLSPLIEAGQIEKAQQLSEVKLSGTNISSHAGFFTVDKKYDSNMFFWFFPAKVNPETAPVLLWLQGGPGGSSLFGLFVESGPIGVSKDTTLFEREVTWANKYSMLYIDNPVGTGFSYTKSDSGYSTTEEEVAENLYSALSQFFMVFPSLKKNPFYLTGESYAGKYIPAIAHRIHIQKESLVPLTGLAIGDGFTDPQTMLPAYADFLYNIGMLDENQRETFRKTTDKAVDMIKNKQYKDAFLQNNVAMDFFTNCTGANDLYNYLRTNTWDAVLNGDESPYPSFFTNCTGSTDYFNFLRTQSPVEFDYYTKLLALPEVRKAIHVGSLTYNDGNAVEKHLLNDIMQSVRPWLAEAMDNYRVMIYSGHLDIIVALPLTQAMLQQTEWKYLSKYQQADRSVWKILQSDTEVAGYVRNVGDFYQVVVRGGGHILPFDQPERSFDMIDRFVSGRGFK